MAENVSRNTFDPTKNFDRVIFNQKRSLLDAELNEAQDILAEMTSLLSEQGVGDGPFGDSFEVFATGNDNEISVRAGAFWNRGNLVRIHQDTIISNLTLPVAGDRIDQVYIKYSIVSIDSSTDSELIDPEIGIETATRRQIQAEVDVAEGVSIPTVDFETEFVIPIAQINRLNLDPSITQDMIVDTRKAASRNYIEDGLFITTQQPNVVEFEAGNGVVGNRKFSVEAGSANVVNTLQIRKWFVDENGNLTNGVSFPSSFHVPIAETYLDQTTGLYTAIDKRIFIPIAGLPTDFPITSLEVVPLGTQVTIREGLVYVDGTDVIRFPQTTIDLGTGGSHELPAISANNYQKVLISLDRNSQVNITTGTSVATEPDENTANPDYPDDELPIAEILVRDDGRSLAGSIRAISAANVLDARPFLNLGSNNEVVTARGTQSSLNERLSNSLTEAGKIKANAGTIDTLQDLRVEPTKGQDPDYPTPSKRVYVQPGDYNFGRFAARWQGGVSSQFVNPSSGTVRKDLLVLTEDNELEIYQGTAVSIGNTPQAPTHADQFPLAEIYLEDSTNEIREEETKVSFAVEVSPGIYRIADTDGLITQDDEFVGFTIRFTSGNLMGKSYTIEDSIFAGLDPAAYGFIISDAVDTDFGDQISANDEFIVTQISRVRPINARSSAVPVQPQRHLLIVSGGTPGFASGGVTMGAPGVPIDAISGYDVTLPFTYLSNGLELLIYRNGNKLILDEDYIEVPTAGNLKTNQVRFLNNGVTTFFPIDDRLEFLIVAGAQSDFAPGINPPERATFVATAGQTDFVLPFTYIPGRSTNDYEQNLLVFVDGAKAVRQDGGNAMIVASGIASGFGIIYEEPSNTVIRFTVPLIGGELVEAIIPAGALTDNLDLASNWQDLGTRLKPKRGQGIEFENLNAVPDIRGTSNTWNISNAGAATFVTVNGNSPDNILSTAAFSALTGGGVADSFHTHAGLASAGRVFNSPPNFDSEFINVGPGTTALNFAARDLVTGNTNSLGLDPQQWIIMIEGASDAAGSDYTNQGIGLEENGGTQQGFAYQIVDKDNINIIRGTNEPTFVWARVRIWDYSKGPASTNSKQALVTKYDTGWVSFNPGQSITFDHDLGSDVINGTVVLEGSSSSDGSNPHNNAIGLDEKQNGFIVGARWFSLTNSSITIERGSGDNIAPAQTRWNYIRVRILLNEFISVAPAGGQLGLGKPNFDSGWFNRTSDWILFNNEDPDHTLGGDPANFFVQILQRDTTGISGIHQRGQGGDTDNVGSTNFAYYTNLEARRLFLNGAADDGSTLYDQVRIKIWDTSTGVATPDASEALVLKYDSGYTSISLGQTITFNHNIGEDADEYVVDLSFRDSSGKINAKYLGLDTQSNGNIRGAYWTESTNNSIKVTRESFDTTADEVRVRIFRLEPVAAIYPITRIGKFYPTRFLSNAGKEPSETLLGTAPALYPAWWMDPVSEDELNWSFDLPSDLDTDFPITINVYWTADDNTTVGDIVLNFTYRVTNIADDLNVGSFNATTMETLTPTSDLAGAQYNAVNSQFEISASALSNLTDLVGCQLEIDSTSTYIPNFYITKISMDYTKLE